MMHTEFRKFIVPIYILLHVHCTCIDKYAVRVHTCTCTCIHVRTFTRPVDRVFILPESKANQGRQKFYEIIGNTIYFVSCEKLGQIFELNVQQE